MDGLPSEQLEFNSDFSGKLDIKEMAQDSRKWTLVQICLSPNPESTTYEVGDTGQIM